MGTLSILCGLTSSEAEPDTACPIEAFTDDLWESSESVEVSGILLGGYAEDAAGDCEFGLCGTGQANEGPREDCAGGGVDVAAYYNEIDPFAAAWLRELIKAGLIADGEVDTRSIVDVQPGDVRGFTQCHWFAGIGGWSYALRLAGWDDDRPVWTGSCPCQPFSSAGAQTGGNDPRDLWPVWFQFVKECRPVVVFGEQVEAAIGHGWLDRLCDDLESEDYAVGAAGLPGPSVGAYDIRQRLWFVAHTDDAGSQGRARGELPERADQRPVGSGRAFGIVADTERPPWRSSAQHRSDNLDEVEIWPQGSGWSGERGAVGELADASGRGLGINGRSSRHTGHVDERQSVGRLDDTTAEGRQRLSAEGRPDVSDASGPSQTSGMAYADKPQSSDGGLQRGRRFLQSASDAASSFWFNAEWLDCADGKARPIEPGTFPLAHGIPARVGRLRGYGNAIKPQVAAVFIQAADEAMTAGASCGASNHSKRNGSATGKDLV